ncbi:hypothetical protein GGR57DRAFT_478058, partial [Xylariaceae sp. FL1272]
MIRAMNQMSAVKRHTLMIATFYGIPFSSVRLSKPKSQVAASVRYMYCCHGCTECATLNGALDVSVNATCICMYCSLVVSLNHSDPVETVIAARHALHRSARRVDSDVCFRGYVRNATRAQAYCSSAGDTRLRAIMSQARVLGSMSHSSCRKLEMDDSEKVGVTEAHTLCTGYKLEGLAKPEELIASAVAARYPWNRAYCDNDAGLSDLPDWMPAPVGTGHCLPDFRNL